MRQKPTSSSSVELEVPFHDVDALRIVWHGNYYKYFEVARTALLRARGLDDYELPGNHRLVVIETRCRHTYPLRYGDRFRVDAWFEDIDVRLNVAYEITNLTAERRTAKGHTILATLDSGGIYCWLHPMRYFSASRRELIGALLAVCVAQAGAAPARADEAAGGRAELGALLTQLAAAPGVSAHFREEKKLTLLTHPLVSEGDIAFTRPPALFRRVTQPEPSTILLRDGRLETRDASGQRTLDLSAHPAARILAESFLHVLAGDQAALERNYDVRFTGSAKQSWSLTLVPKLPALGRLVRELSLEGAGLRLASLRIIEANGDASTTTFSAVDTQRRFSAEERRTLFGFTADK